MFSDMIFAERAGLSLQRFRKVSNTKYNARCPVCGDSHKDENKTRFWFYVFEGKWRAGCFNCNYNVSFGTYLKEYEHDLYREWLLERRRTTAPVQAEQPKNKAVMPKVEKIPFCERLDTLPRNHPIVMYVASRGIPEKAYSRLWFTTEWKKLAHQFNKEAYLQGQEPEPRLVIPIYDEQKRMHGFQGRALRANSNAKYVTIKVNEDASKVYGRDVIDPEKTVFFMEGPIDSLFLSNAGAITGGQMSLSEIPYKDTRVFALDNEPHSPDTCARMEALIEAGERIVMWDKAPWKSKDINDMIIKEKANIVDIEAYMHHNICSGLGAKLRFTKWRKAEKRQRGKQHD